MQAEHTETRWQYAAVIPSITTRAGKITEMIVEELRRYTWTELEIFAIHLAAEEALQNAIKHGNKCDSEKCVRFACSLIVERLKGSVVEKFHVVVCDEGEGFDPAAVPDCTDEDRMEMPSGRGLKLMRHYMDEVRYDFPEDGGTKVLMHKQRTVAAQLATA